MLSFLPVKILISNGLKWQIFIQNLILSNFSYNFAGHFKRANAFESELSHGLPANARQIPPNLPSLSRWPQPNPYFHAFRVGSNSTQRSQATRCQAFLFTQLPKKHRTRI